MMARNWGLKDKKALVTGDNEVATAVRSALSAEGTQIANSGDTNVHIVVNASADIRSPFSTDLGASSETWNADMVHHFDETRKITHSALPFMIENEFGRVVNVIGSFEPMHFNSEFAAWGAVAAWSKSLTREVGKYGITINSIQPSLIDCDTTRKKWLDEELKAYVSKRIPTGQMCKPSDVANITTYLCSSFARYITGTVIPVDGGMSRHQH